MLGAAAAAAGSRRAFSTTPAAHRQTPTHLKVPFEQVPDYPYGPFRWYKQRNVGLYGTSKVRFGNTIAAKYGNKSWTMWRPNRHTKRLWSPALGAFIRTRLTAGVLRTVDKLGGIDNYLLGTKARRVKELGPAGWRLRWKVMQSPAVQARWAAERAAMGLPPKALSFSSDDAAAGPQPSADEMAALDAMLARGDEFVIGDVQEGENVFIDAATADADARKAADAVDAAAQEIRDQDVTSQKNLIP